MSLRLKTTVSIAAAILLGAAPAAIADSSSSSNWAGYAVHRPGVRFPEVFAAWRQPTLTCVAGSPSYSAFWIGIGGYRLNAPALEQIGTEADCTSSGRAIANAWYELVPVASKPLKLIVEPGDELAGSVTVSGHTVVLALQDRTRHRSAKRTLHASVVDDTSAEWIAEAPSDCVSNNSCRTLPLANFGSTSFDVAGAQTINGRFASIRSNAWRTTKITLGTGGQRYATVRGGTIGSATPSALTSGGSAFNVTYSAASAPGTPVFASQRRVNLVHPGLF
jgi:hypothetical protein